MNPCPASRFRIYDVIGEGSFGTVFRGYDCELKKLVAIKIMKPQRLALIKREVFILCSLAGKPSIVNLTNVVIDWLTRVPSMVFEYLEHEHYDTMFPKLSVTCVLDYMYQLLRALYHCRCHGIMHRDVKPGNVLYQPELWRLKLIDWGTAEIYLPDKDLPYRVGTRAFRAPELLAGCMRYDFSVDMWSAGCVLWQIVSGSKDPVFGYGRDEVSQLRSITQRLGAKAFNRFYEALVRKKALVTSEILRECPIERDSLAPTEDMEKIPRLSDCKERGAFDLLDGMLCFDPSARLLPARAMEHIFFKTIHESQCREQDALE